MVAKLSDRVGGEEFPRPIVVGENLLLNGNRKINTRGFAGGQPAAGVYGYDMWKGSADGLQSEQVVVNDSDLTGDYAISWEGGTGTASVNGTAGLASGDIVQLTVSGNFSVIVPTDATKIKFEQFAVTPYQERKNEAQLCLPFAYRTPAGSRFMAFAYGDRSNIQYTVDFPVVMHGTPDIAVIGTATDGVFGGQVSNSAIGLPTVVSANVRGTLLNTTIVANGGNSSGVINFNNDVYILAVVEL